MKKRIGIFYINTGGGHRSAALAIRDEINDEYQNVAVAEAFEVRANSKFVSFILNSGYMVLSTYIPLWWTFTYWLSGTRLFNWVYYQWFGRSLSKAVFGICNNNQFDTLVTTHPFITWSLERYAKTQQQSRPLICVVTDPFTLHRYWFNNPSFNFIVYSDVAKQAAMGYGVTDNQITVVPPVYNSEYLQQYSHAEFKNNLGISASDRLVTIIGGGNGLKYGYSLAWQICKKTSDIKLAIVCGRDFSLYKRMLLLQKQYPDRIIAVQEFVDPYKYLAAADVVVTKAGPGIIFECLALLKPIIITSHAPQEVGNVEYVVQNDFGTYVSRPSLVPNAVVAILNSLERRENIVQNIRKLRPECGTGEIAKIIIGQ